MDVNEQEKEEEKKGLQGANVLDYDAPSFDEQKLLGVWILEYSVINLLPMSYYSVAFCLPVLNIGFVL